METFRDLLLYCRAGFESECAQEVSAAAAAAQTQAGDGFVTAHLPTTLGAQARRELADWRRPIFARQCLPVFAKLDALPRADRLTPILAALEKRGERYADAWVEAPDSDEGKALAPFCRSFGNALIGALKRADMLDARPPGRSPSAPGRSPSAAEAMDGRERPAEAMDGRERPSGTMQPGANGMPQVDPKLMEQMMQQNMQHMTKEQRAQTEEAMKNMRASGYFGPQSEPVIEATGEKREVGGLSCAVERITQDGQLLREDCRTTLDAIGLDPADVKRMLRVIVRMQKYSSAVTSNLRLIKNVSVRRDNVDPQHPLVERRCFEQGNPSGDVTLHVRSQSVPADWFVTPPDYARMDMGMRGH